MTTDTKSIITKLGENSVTCPDCRAPGTASVRLVTGQVIGYYLCGANSLDDHRTPKCYEQELAREVLRRTDTLEYTRQRLIELPNRQGPAQRELVNVTSVLCGGKPTIPETAK